MWKFPDFSAKKILREIKFQWIQNIKNCNFRHFQSQMVYNLIFDYYEVRLFLISHKYTLFGRKMSKFPHCGKMLKSTDL